MDFRNYLIKYCDDIAAAFTVDGQPPVDLDVFKAINMFEIIGLYADIKILYTVSCILIGIITLILLPVLKEGVEKWKI